MCLFMLLRRGNLKEKKLWNCRRHSPKENVQEEDPKGDTHVKAILRGIKWIAIEFQRVKVFLTKSYSTLELVKSLLYVLIKWYGFDHGVPSKLLMRFICTLFRTLVPVSNQKKTLLGQKVIDPKVLARTHIWVPNWAPFLGQYFRLSLFDKMPTTTHAIENWAHTETLRDTLVAWSITFEDNKDMCVHLLQAIFHKGQKTNSPEGWWHRVFCSRSL